MLEKGEISFVFLWVLNPFVILFYQNCSMVPVHPQRAVAAVEKPQAAPLVRACQPSLARACAE
jgi:hypothetical protein